MCLYWHSIRTTIGKRVLRVSVFRKDMRDQIVHLLLDPEESTLNEDMSEVIPILLQVKYINKVAIQHIKLALIKSANNN